MSQTFYDISFDITQREISMFGSGASSDFQTTTNPSVQNGGIALFSLCADPLFPMFGIGLVPQIINGPQTDLAYELNRWVAMAILDGATLAKWTSVQQGGNAVPDIQISYL